MTPDPGDNAHIFALRDQIKHNCEAVQSLRGEVRAMTESDQREHSNINASLANHGEQLSNIRTAVKTSGWWVASLISIIGILVASATYLTYDAFNFLHSRSLIQDARLEHNARQADKTEARGTANATRIDRNEKDIHQLDGRVRTLEQKR